MLEHVVETERSRPQTLCHPEEACRRRDLRARKCERTPVVQEVLRCAQDDVGCPSGFLCALLALVARFNANPKTTGAASDVTGSGTADRNALPYDWPIWSKCST